MLVAAASRLAPPQGIDVLAPQPRWGTFDGLVGEFHSHRIHGTIMDDLYIYELIYNQNQPNVGKYS